MHAITLTEPGGPDVMVWREHADPQLAPGHVLIDVVATAVNRADVLQRQGNYPPPPGASEVLGLECSGTIAALGEGVTQWSIGDEVCALLAGGGYAEQVVVPAAQVLPVPDGMDVATAAALPEVACTVWSNVVMEAGLGHGDVLLVHGGAGGIGTHAIQVGKALGATVATTAGSPSKLERCRELGADILIDYKKDDFVEAVRNATDGHGADVVLDNMGAKYLDRNLDVLAFDGRLSVIGMQGGRTGELNLGKLLLKRGHVFATGLRGRPVTGEHSKAEIVEQVRTRLWPLIEQGLVAPVVSAELPIAEAPRGHELLDSPDSVGKVVLRVR
ncbi:NAD(P)H-quinone oxidoreductase [Rhodococcus sp. HNM0569]|uniref:NAD(P)H-quinone oxidoreductase n=1 Tax=Rhodococcus sp. HNM0569 TaxID=2716340 RepID=UPI00146BB7A6|nr:NAD(P)H-quinone oxidoreductase [Rhodococcus sp. HNM0569]NLU83557.1 NAD(P)H-quinone oxidoreductase [Rhodococcus sp. HNM0569]